MKSVLLLDTLFLFVARRTLPLQTLLSLTTVNNQFIVIVVVVVVVM